MGEDSETPGLPAQLVPLTRAHARVAVAAASVSIGARARLEAAAEDAVRVMTALLELGEPYEQANAARVILAAWVGLRPLEGTAMGDPSLTPEQRVLAIRQALRNPEPELAAALEAEGMRPAARLGDGEKP